MILLLNILIISLAILGWHYAIDYDIVTPAFRIKDDGKLDMDSELIHPFGAVINNKEILWFIKFYMGRWLYKFKIGRYLCKPLLLCPVCMSSIYGTILYTLMAPHFAIVGWLVTILGVAGLNRILLKFIQ